MRNASGHRCKVKISGSEKKTKKEKKKVLKIKVVQVVNENTYDISSIKRVTKKFLEVSGCSRAKQRQRKVQKKVCCTCKVAFLLIRPVAVFHRYPVLPSPQSITLFCILFEQTYKYDRELRF